MYLLKMTNIDYMVMTVLFAILAMTGYLFRRKNNSSGDFLTIKSHNVNSFANLISISGVGLPEFILLSSIAACFGLPVLCLFIPIFIICSLWFDRVNNNSTFIQNLVDAKASNLDQRGFYISYGLFLLLISGVTIAIMVSLLKSLLGWEFGNSSLSLMGIIAVCLLLGGLIAVVYSQFIATCVVAVAIFVVLFIAYQKIGFGHIIANLQSVATDNKLPLDTFVKTKYSAYGFENFVLLLFITLTLSILYPLNWIKSKKNTRLAAGKFLITGRIIQLILLIGVLFIGIFALATPLENKNINGNIYVTQQVKLDDGSMGFVVKAVQSDTPAMQRGLIPAVSGVDEDFTSKFSEQAVLSSGFDFISSSLILIKHSLPYAFVSLLVVILLFYRTTTECLSFITLLTINGFYAPYYNKTGEEYENLWATRVFMFMFIVVAISVGLVLYKFFDLYYICGIVLLFAISPALYLLGFKVNWWAHIIMWLLVIIGLLIQNIENIPTLLPLVKFSNWSLFIICIGGGLMLLHVILSAIYRFSIKGVVVNG